MSNGTSPVTPQGEISDSENVPQRRAPARGMLAGAKNSPNEVRSITMKTRIFAEVLSWLVPTVLDCGRSYRMMLRWALARTAPRANGLYVDSIAWR